MNLRAIMIGTLLLALAASSAWAQDKPKRDRPAAPEARMKARAEGPMEARRFLEMMHDPLIAGQLAIARIRELALQAKKPDMAVELLEHVAREAEPAPLKRTALFFASELHAKAGRYEAAAETLVKMLGVRDRPGPERARREGDELARQAREIHQWLREHPGPAARIIASLRGDRVGPTEAPFGQRRRARGYFARGPRAIMRGRAPKPLRGMPRGLGRPNVERRERRPALEGLLQPRQREEMRRRLGGRREEMERRDQPEARQRRESPEQRDREKALKGKERPQGPERREREKAVKGKVPAKAVKGKEPEKTVEGRERALDRLREHAQDLERLKRQLQERAKALERRENELRIWAERLEKRQREMERERERPRER